MGLTGGSPKMSGIVHQEFLFTDEKWWCAPKKCWFHHHFHVDSSRVGASLGSYGYSPEDFGMTIPWRMVKIAGFLKSACIWCIWIYIYIYGMVINLGIEPFGVWKGAWPVVSNHPENISHVRPSSQISQRENEEYHSLATGNFQNRMLKDHGGLCTTQPSGTLRPHEVNQPFKPKETSWRDICRAKSWLWAVYALFPPRENGNKLGCKTHATQFKSYKIIEIYRNASRESKKIRPHRRCRGVFCVPAWTVSNCIIANKL